MFARLENADMVPVPGQSPDQGKEGKAEYIRLLAGEVPRDLPLCKTDASAAAQANGAINKHVGILFGAWKKKKANQ